MPSLDGWYEASSAGRIRSWKTAGSKPRRAGEPHLLKPSPGPDGYLRVYAGTSGDKRPNKCVHHLVAEAFHGPRPRGLVVRHRDGNQTNNRASNLSWATNSVNQMDRIEHGTSNRGTRNGQHKLTEAEVLLIVERGGGEPMQAIANSLGVSRRMVGMILSGHRWAWLTGLSTEAA